MKLWLLCAIPMLTFRDYCTVMSTLLEAVMLEFVESVPTIEKL